MTLPELLGHISDNLMNDRRFSAWLGGGAAESIAAAKQQLTEGAAQLQGEHYGRLILDTASGCARTLAMKSAKAFMLIVSAPDSCISCETIPLSSPNAAASSGAPIGAEITAGSVNRARESSISAEQFHSSAVPHGRQRSGRRNRSRP